MGCTGGWESLKQCHFPLEADADSPHVVCTTDAPRRHAGSKLYPQPPSVGTADSEPVNGAGSATRYTHAGEKN